MLFAVLARCNTWILAIMFLTSSAHSIQCQSATATEVGIAVGDRTNHKIHIYRLLIRRPWNLPESIHPSEPWETKWQLAVDSWQPHNAHGGGLQTVSLRAVLARRLPPSGHTLIEVGTGPLYLDRTRSLTRLNWGTHLQFDSHIAITREFGPDYQYSFHYALHHASNGGLNRINPGVNFQMIEIARTFH